jgi:hypothetical protein
MTKDLPQNKTVYWRVQAKNAISKGAWSAGSFHTGNPPSVPVLAAPANGSLVKDYTPLLNWSNATAPGGTDFKEYQVQADDNSDFSSPEVDATTTLNTVANSDFTPLSDLTSNTKFFWRVRSRNIVNGAEEHFSAWSTVWTFRTVIQQPQNLTMVDNAANHLRPTFDWDDATGTITNYTIQISTVANFSSFFVNSTTASSGYTLLKNLPANKTIYVRVKVNGANGPSAWTTIQFTSAAAP